MTKPIEINAFGATMQYDEIGQDGDSTWYSVTTTIAGMHFEAIPPGVVLVHPGVAEDSTRSEAILLRHAAWASTRQRGLSGTDCEIKPESCYAIYLVRDGDRVGVVISDSWERPSLGDAWRRIGSVRTDERGELLEMYSV